MPQKHFRRHWTYQPASSAPSWWTRIEMCGGEIETLFGLRTFVTKRTYCGHTWHRTGGEKIRPTHHPKIAGYILGIVLNGGQANVCLRQSPHRSRYNGYCRDSCK